MNAAHVALVLLVLVAGCTAGVGPETASPSPTSSPTPDQMADCVQDVSFWGLSGSTAADLWADDVVRIGYTLPASSSTLFVAYENETVLGWTYVENGDPEHAIASDGDPIELDHELRGTHTVRVVVYRDSNGNEAFDADADEQCTRDGDVVQAGPREIDFDRFGSNGTATT